MKQKCLQYAKDSFPLKIKKKYIYIVLKKVMSFEKDLEESKILRSLCTSFEKQRGFKNFKIEHP